MKYSLRNMKYAAHIKGEFYFIAHLRYFMRKHFMSRQRHFINENVMKENKLVDLSIDLFVIIRIIYTFHK